MEFIMNTLDMIKLKSNSHEDLPITDLAHPLNTPYIKSADDVDRMSTRPFTLARQNLFYDS